jgi:hypothetical protein
VPDPTFDPRFDPAFQRGYEPPARDSESPPTRIAAEGFDGAESSGSAEPDVHPGGAEPGQTQGEEPDAEPVPLESGPIEPNPFERILGVVAAVLVIAGVALTFWANSTSYNGPGDVWGWQQIVQASVWALSSPMITVGLATGVALVFRRAITWKSDS